MKRLWAGACVTAISLGGCAAGSSLPAGKWGRVVRCLERHRAFDVFDAYSRSAERPAAATRAVSVVGDASGFALAYVGDDALGADDTTGSAGATVDRTAGPLQYGFTRLANAREQSAVVNCIASNFTPVNLNPTLPPIPSTDQLGLPTSSSTTTATTTTSTTATTTTTTSTSTTATTTTSTTSAATTTEPLKALAHSRSCGNGVTAGEHTTCAFALNVTAAYDGAAAAQLHVYSPVTHKTYVMRCSVSGPSVACTGGVSASVSFLVPKPK